MSGKRVELWIHADSEEAVVVHVPRERIASALLNETTPIVVHEAWGNGDSARVVVERVPWRQVDWRLTTQGWVRGLYRVWCDASGGGGDNRYRFECSCERFVSDSFESLEAAKTAAMRHADTYGW